MEIVIWCHSSDQKDVHLCDGQWENAGLFKLVFDTAVVDLTSCYVRVFWERWRLWFGVTAAIRKTFICAMAQWQNAGFLNRFSPQQLWTCGLDIVDLDLSILSVANLQYRADSECRHCFVLVLWARLCGYDTDFASEQFSHHCDNAAHPAWQKCCKLQFPNHLSFCEHVRT